MLIKQQELCVENQSSSAQMQNLAHLPVSEIEESNDNSSALNARVLKKLSMNFLKPGQALYHQDFSSTLKQVQSQEQKLLKFNDFQSLKNKLKKDLLTEPHQDD